MRRLSLHLLAMTRETHPHDLIRDDLTDRGFDPETVQALLTLDVENFHYVRRVMKGDLPQTLIEEIGAGLEVTQFHALTAILRIRGGYLRPATEATVGLLAEEMALDPSRASRIAADLVERGLLERAVSQEDGRRSVLVPTPAARALLDRFLRAKWDRTLRIFESWSAQDIQSFATLFARYAAGIRDQYPARPADPR